MQPTAQPNLRQAEPSPAVQPTRARGASGLTIWGGRLMVIAALVHLAIFSALTWRDWGAWATGALWGELPSTLRGYQLHFEFWGLVGSFAAVLLLLGLVIVHCARRGFTLPGYVGWGLLAWTALGTALLEPSGYPVGVVASILLIMGRRRDSAGG